MGNLCSGKSSVTYDLKNISLQSLKNLNERELEYLLKTFIETRTSQLLIVEERKILQSIRTQKQKTLKLSKERSNIQEYFSTISGSLAAIIEMIKRFEENVLKRRSNFSKKQQQIKKYFEQFLKKVQKVKIKKQIANFGKPYIEQMYQTISKQRSSASFRDKSHSEMSRKDKVAQSVENFVTNMHRLEQIQKSFHKGEINQNQKSSFLKSLEEKYSQQISYYEKLLDQEREKRQKLEDENQKFQKLWHQQSRINLQHQVKLQEKNTQIKELKKKIQDIASEKNQQSTKIQKQNSEHYQKIIDEKNEKIEQLQKEIKILDNKRYLNEQITFGESSQVERKSSKGGLMLGEKSEVKTKQIEVSQSFIQRLQQKEKDKKRSSIQIKMMPVSSVLFHKNLDQEIQARQLLSEMLRRSGCDVIESEMVFSFDPINPNRMIDYLKGKNHIVIGKMKNDVILGGYSKDPFNECTQKNTAFLFSIHPDGKNYYLTLSKDAKAEESVEIDYNFLAFGSNQLRFKSQTLEGFANIYGLAAKFICPEGDITFKEFLDHDSRSFEMKSCQIHSLTLKQEKQFDEQSQYLS